MLHFLLSFKYTIGPFIRRVGISRPPPGPDSLRISQMPLRAHELQRQKLAAMGTPRENLLLRTQLVPVLLQARELHLVAPTHPADSGCVHKRDARALALRT